MKGADLLVALDVVQDDASDEGKLWALEVLASGGVLHGVPFVAIIAKPQTSLSSSSWGNRSTSWSLASRRYGPTSRSRTRNHDRRTSGSSSGQHWEQSQSYSTKRSGFIDYM